MNFFVLLTLVTDSVGAMFGYAKLTEDMNTKQFEEAINDDFVPDWVVGFFRFVKASYDDNRASFVFVTSKPMHLVIEIPKIKHYMIGNVVKMNLDNKNYSYLSLDLSDEDVKTYLTQRVPKSMVESFFSEIQDKEKEGKAEFERRRIAHLAAMVDALSEDPKWKDKLMEAEKAKTDQ